MGRNDTWSDDGSPSGGVGTIIRPGAKPSAVPTAAPSAEPRVRRGGQARPAPPGARGARALVPGAVPRRATQAPPRPAAPGVPHPAQQHAAQQHRTQRMPFLFVLCGLLGGALVSALVISTTLAEGSYQITRLQQANSALARQRQTLQAQVASEQSAQVIEQRAFQLGMRPVGEMRFINLKNGRIETDAGRGAVADIHVPGYTP